MINVQKSTRVGIKGKSLVCPTCGAVTVVCDLGWSSLQCEHCINTIDKYDWLMYTNDEFESFRKNISDLIWGKLVLSNGKSLIEFANESKVISCSYPDSLPLSNVCMEVDDVLKKMDEVEISKCMADSKQSNEAIAIVIYNNVYQKLFTEFIFKSGYGNNFRNYVQQKKINIKHCLCISDVRFSNENNTLITQIQKGECFPFFLDRSLAENNQIAVLKVNETLVHSGSYRKDFKLNFKEITELEYAKYSTTKRFDL